jgi:hypothetical protein
MNGEGEKRLRQTVRRIAQRPIAIQPMATPTGTVLNALERIEQQVHDLSQYLLNGLHSQVSAHFDDEELTQLAFGLGIEIEDLPGRTRSSRARALITHCLQHGQIDDLILALRRARPHLPL